MWLIISDFLSQSIIRHLSSESILNILETNILKAVASATTVTIAKYLELDDMSTILLIF